MEPTANRHSPNNKPQIAIDFLSKFCSSREYYSLMSSAFQSIDSSECSTEPERCMEYLINSLSKSGIFFVKIKGFLLNYFILQYTSVYTRILLFYLVEAHLHMLEDQLYPHLWTNYSYSVLENRLLFSSFYSFTLSFAKFFSGDTSIFEECTTFLATSSNAQS